MERLLKRKNPAGEGGVGDSRILWPRKNTQQLKRIHRNLYVISPHCDNKL